MKRITLSLIFFVLLLQTFISGNIVLDEVRGNLRCVNRGDGVPRDPSAVGGAQNMVCSPLSSSYSRIAFDVTLNSVDNVQSADVHEILMVSSGGSSNNIGTGHGCQSTPEGDRSAECTKLGLQLTTINNGSYNLLPGPDLQELLGLSDDDLHHVIQGLGAREIDRSGAARTISKIEQS